MAESVGKMQTQHGVTPDVALIDGPYAPLALTQNPHVQVHYVYEVYMKARYSIDYEYFVYIVAIMH